MKALSLSALMAVSISCASAPKLGDEKIPAQLSSVFSTCSGGDGAFNIELHDNSQFLGSLDLEWISKNNGWRLELLNPMGNTELQLDYKVKDNYIRQMGPLAGKLPPLSVDESQRLQVDGHHVGLKAKELPCILSYQLPYRWLLKLRNVMNSKDGYAYYFEDEERKVDVKFDLREPDEFQSFCSRVRWPIYLGLSQQQMIVCVHKKDGRMQARIQGLKDYVIKWIDIDD